MEKLLKKRKDKPFLPSVVREHQLEQRYERGDLRIEVAEDPQHARKKVTRLRRKCVYDEMMNRGSITEKQRDCAERYAILCEKAFGQSSSIYARTTNWLKEGRNYGNWEPNPAQHDAYGKLFRIWQELGCYHRDILNMIILGNMRTKEISQILHLNLNYMMGQVLSAFILLEEAMENR